ncbi:MAG: hypothetical protein H6937_07225 [Burkholderiales bacterium]|nr:hypothetical protein [Burkholderiales bacterium]
MSNAQRQAQWDILLSPLAQKPGDPVEDDESSKEKKQPKMYGRKSSHGNFCYLSLDQIARMMFFMTRHSKLGGKYGSRRCVYDDLMKEKLLTDDRGREMSLSNFGQYYAVAVTRKNTGDPESVVRHCLKYRLTFEVAGVIAGIKRQEAFALVTKIKKELSE